MLNKNLLVINFLYISTNKDDELLFYVLLLYINVKDVYLEFTIRFIKIRRRLYIFYYLHLVLLIIYFNDDDLILT